MKKNIQKNDINHQYYDQNDAVHKVIVIETLYDFTNIKEPYECIQKDKVNKSKKNKGKSMDFD